MNLNSFNQFLSSLSKISRWHFEVWDTDRAVFSSNGQRSKMPFSSDIRELSIRTISNGIFQHACPQGKHEVFGIPIKNADKVIGALIACTQICVGESEAESLVCRKSSHAKEMQKFLTDLLGLMEDKWTTENEVEEITEELTRNFEDIYLYSNIATRIKSLRFSNDMLNDLAEELLEAMRTELAFARMPNRKEFDTLVTKRGVDGIIPQPNAFVDNLIEAIPKNTVGLKNNYFLVADSKEAPGFRALHPEAFRFLAVKMHHKDHFYGWLGLVSLDAKEIFRRSELRMMSSMAEQLAMVIANTDMYDDLEVFVINVVKSLVYAIETKDEYTRGHSERVNRYAMLMGTRLRLDEKQSKSLHWASMLHDIGKIGIPETILNKPGVLTDAEYNIITSHSKKGCDILEPLEQLSTSLPGVMHHHERYDGQGYPHGLKGKDIPVLGRIIAVADTFDAITSSRAYRPGKTAMEALEIIEKVAGTQLDPDLVEVFKEVLLEVDLREVPKR
jgi:HD-GYP domain-containing protein (c-di-GMP phosphodiesterase class II)